MEAPEIPHPDEVKEHAEDPFNRRVALSVAVYAVGLAIASFGGHNAAKEMMMAKQEEANQWNRYQSKSTREALYRNEIMKLEAEKKGAGRGWPPEREELLAEYRKQADRMAADKKEIEEGNRERKEKGARDYQKDVELMQRKDPYFDFAEVGFQLAIVLASVAMLSKKPWAFHASLALAAASVLLAANGFTLAVEVPWLGGSH